MRNRLVAISLAVILAVAWPLIRSAAQQLHSSFPLAGFDLLMLIAFLAGPVTLALYGDRTPSGKSRRCRKPYV